MSMLAGCLFLRLVIAVLPVFSMFSATVCVSQSRCKGRGFSRPCNSSQGYFSPLQERWVLGGWVSVCYRLKYFSGKWVSVREGTVFRGERDGTEGLGRYLSRGIGRLGVQDGGLLMKRKGSADVFLPAARMHRGKRCGGYRSGCAVRGRR